MKQYVEENIMESMLKVIVLFLMANNIVQVET